MTDVRLGKILAARGITGVVQSSFETGAREVKFDWDKFAAVRIEMQPVRPPSARWSSTMCGRSSMP
jgi:hypothetical protein